MVTGAPAGRWIAVHVYYRTDQDDLLLRCVGPLAGRLRLAGDIDRFFFLRYWQGGLHLRLRWHCRPDRADAVRDRVHHELRTYLARRPSRQPVDPAGHAAALQRLARLEGERAEAAIVPDNSVLDATYEPELGKYGGAAGVAAAEQVFDHSSRAVLRGLQLCRSRPKARLGLGVRMMMLTLGAAGLPAGEAAGFLARYADFWSAYLPPGARRRWPELAAGYDAGGYPPAALGVDPELDRLAGEWAAAVAGAVAGRDSQLLFNHLHTHNNRLGIAPAHESYLAFLAHHGLAAAS